MLKVLNTETKQLEEFREIEKGIVKFYHCGPTVYWTQHIGNLRGMTLADLIRRSFIYLDYEVNFVRNYTDVGHLTSDGDEGEDKMEKGAKREGLSPEQIAQKYIDIFENDTAELNIVEPNAKPKATAYIEEMIAMVQQLLDKGFAYSTEDAIYFDISKAKDYTRLSGQKLDQNEAGAGHGDVASTNKRNAADFAIWFFKTGPHKNALQVWKSPFKSALVDDGQGFPGWHIECSAMARDLLGDTIDIHMGGIEHIPVHHTNEIAQSEAATGKQFVNYWLHNEHLMVDGEKMAKSSGTSYTLSDIKDRGFEPLDLRYFFMQAHYRSKQNFTWDALEAAATARKSLSEKVSRLVVGEVGQQNIDLDYKQKFIAAISNDFNIPQALAIVWDVLKSDLEDEDKLATILEFDEVLGLDLAGQLDRVDLQLSQEVLDLLDSRSKARAEKNWELSDTIRDTLRTKHSLDVEDTAGGQSVRRT